MGEAIELRYYSTIESAEVEWLWYPYIPYGKLTVLQGDPGEGKSTLIINVTALLTTGRPMPDGYMGSGPHRVIYQCAEDDVADTIKPRLVAAGADDSMVAFIQDDDNLLTLDDERIERAIFTSKARLLVLDPFQAFLPQDADMQNAQRMRGVLRKLTAVAAKTRCAIVLVGHMNKASTEKNLYRGLGSIDIAAIARSVLMIGRDSCDQNIRYMFPVKSSLAPEGVSVAFTFEREGGFRWIGPCEYEPDMDQSAETSKRDRAAKVLMDILGEGEKESREIFRVLELEGISHRTVQTAKKDLNLEAIRKNGIWYWRIPASLAFSSEMGSSHVR